MLFFYWQYTVDDKSMSQSLSIQKYYLIWNCKTRNTGCGFGQFLLWLGSHGWSDIGWSLEL